MATKEEILKRYLQKPNTLVSDVVVELDALEAMQEFSDQSNSQLMKENENLKKEVLLTEQIVNDFKDLYSESQSTIKQLKESLQKISQMSDSGNPIDTIINIKSIATAALNQS